MQEHPSAVVEDGLEIFVGVIDFIIRRAVADLQIKTSSSVSLMRQCASPVPALKPAHIPGANLVFSIIRNQGRMTLNDVNEFILFSVTMAQSRAALGAKVVEIDAKIRKIEQIPKMRLSRPSCARQTALDRPIFGARGTSVARIGVLVGQLAPEVGLV